MNDYKLTKELEIESSRYLLRTNKGKRRDKRMEIKSKYTSFNLILYKSKNKISEGSLFYVRKHYWGERNLSSMYGRFTSIEYGDILGMELNMKRDRRNRNYVIYL